MPKKTPLALVLAVVGFALALAAPALAQQQPNLILFVADGLRASSVTPQNSPTFARLRAFGVDFVNSHALFPTFTTANASAIATGHYLGDTGDFGNSIYTGFPVVNANGIFTPFIQSNAVLAELNQHYAGNFLNERSLIAAARAAGYQTAVLGKTGAVGIFDVTELNGKTTIFFDDGTGRRDGIELTSDLVDALNRLGLPLQTPERVARGAQVTETNAIQQNYLRDVTTKVLLPRFKETGKPFILVYWSLDPDGTQHAQTDSIDKLVPGINGPTSLAAVRNADENLGAILAKLKELGLDSTTNVLVTADHGFTTISKESATSTAAKFTYPSIPAGQLPPGFVAIDLAEALSLPLHEPFAAGPRVDYKEGKHPRRANGFIGNNPAKPDVVIAANGGADLIYLPQANAKEFAPRVVNALLAQDYVSGIFVNPDLGAIAGTLPLNAVGLKGSALTPTPSIVVSFRSFGTGCAKPVSCTAAIADTLLRQGQGMHGTLSRADTKIFLAAIGPAFKRSYRSLVPVSNADIAPTLARVMGLELPSKGGLRGRVISEALSGGKSVRATRKSIVSAPGDGGLRTVLNLQYVGDTPYFDAGGFIGRTVGLKPPSKREIDAAMPRQQTTAR
jgi:arylsulfatase A-like enzyme